MPVYSSLYSKVCEIAVGRTQGFFALSALLCAPSVFAQPADGSGTGPRQGILVQPTLSVSERYSNNAKQAATGQQSEFVTQVSPGLSIRSDSARLKGNLDYSLNALYYANGTSGNQLQNSLNTNWAVEAVDNWAFVDAAATISQQSISAFGTRTADTVFNNGNSTETLNYRLSPYVRGEIAGGLSYEARLNLLGTNAEAKAASDLRTFGTQWRLSGRRSGAVGWSLEATTNKSTYSLGRTVENDLLTGRLDYIVNPQLTVFFTAGREANNYSTVAKESYPTAGAGFAWRFSQRTKLEAQAERRSFGHSHNLNFEHRTGQTSWRYSDVQSASNSPNQSAIGAVGTLAQLLSFQFEALEPDPVRRAELVNNFLLANGYNPNAQVLSNFLTSSASRQRVQQLSMALTGIRDTVTIAYSRSSNRRLDNVVSALDDFSSSDLIQQAGIVMSYSHRLTRDAALSVSFARQNTAGVQNALGTSLRALDVTLSGRLGRQLFASFGVRHSTFDSSTAPYTETGVNGTLTMRF